MKFVGFSLSLWVYSFFFMQIMRVFAHPVQQITGSSNSSHWHCMKFVFNPSASFLASVRGGQYAAALAT